MFSKFFIEIATRVSIRKIYFMKVPDDKIHRSDRNFQVNSTDVVFDVEQLAILLNRTEIISNKRISRFVISTGMG